MSHSEKSAIVDEFVKPCGILAVLIGTKAISVGIDSQNVSRIYQVGLPSDLLEFDQVNGRGGRNGCPVECTLVCNTSDVTKMLKRKKCCPLLLKFVQNDSECCLDLLERLLERQKTTAPTTAPTTTPTPTPTPSPNLSPTNTTAPAPVPTTSLTTSLTISPTTTTTTTSASAGTSTTTAVIRCCWVCQGHAANQHPGHTDATTPEPMGKPPTYTKTQKLDLKKQLVALKKDLCMVESPEAFVPASVIVGLNDKFIDKVVNAVCLHKPLSSLGWRPDVLKKVEKIASVFKTSCTLSDTSPGSSNNNSNISSSNVYNNSNNNISSCSTESEGDSSDSGNSQEGDGCVDQNSYGSGHDDSVSESESDE